MNRRLKRAFWAFVNAMAAKNYPAAVGSCQLTWCSVANEQAKYLEKYASLDWDGVVFTSVELIGDCAFDVKFTAGETEVVSRWICETKAYTPSQRGKWGVNPYSIKF